MYEQQQPGTIGDMMFASMEEQKRLEEAAIAQQYAPISFAEAPIASQLPAPSMTPFLPPEIAQPAPQIAAATPQRSPVPPALAALAKQKGVTGEMARAEIAQNQNLDDIGAALEGGYTSKMEELGLSKAQLDEQAAERKKAREETDVLHKKMLELINEKPEEKSPLATLGEALAMGMGAFGAAMTGTPNFAMQIINENADRVAKAAVAKRETIMQAYNLSRDRADMLMKDQDSINALKFQAAAAYMDVLRNTLDLRAKKTFGTMTLEQKAKVEELRTRIDAERSNLQLQYDLALRNKTVENAMEMEAAANAPVKPNNNVPFPTGADPQGKAAFSGIDEVTARKVSENAYGVQNLFDAVEALDEIRKEARTPENRIQLYIPGSNINKRIEERRKRFENAARAYTKSGGHLSPQEIENFSMAVNPSGADPFGRSDAIIDERKKMLAMELKMALGVAGLRPSEKYLRVLERPAATMMKTDEGIIPAR